MKISFAANVELLFALIKTIMQFAIFFEGRFAS